MVAQVIQGLFCFVVALLHYVTPAPITKDMTSSTPASTSQSTQKPVASSETAVNFTQTLISTTPYPSTISTVTASKAKLFGELRKIKVKEAKMRSKLDGDFVTSDVTTTPTTSGTPTKYTTQILTTATTTPLPLTTLNFKSKSTEETSPPSLLSTTDGTSSTVPLVSQTTTVMSQTANVTSQSTPGPANSTGPPKQEKDDDDDDLSYEDEYDGKEDWFKTNELIWDFDDDKSFEEEYDQIYDPGSSGDKFREFFINEAKTKPLRLPWE